MSVPDAQIHPHATGPAALTAAKHQDPRDIIFWTGWVPLCLSHFCPASQRVWIALEEKGIPYQYKEVNPYKKEDAFLRINPKGLTPTVQYRGKQLVESLILLEFLEDAYPTYTPHLLPADPFERAQVRLALDHLSKQVLPAFFKTVQAQDKDKQKEELQEYYVALRKLVKEVKGPYFLGEEFSLVDVAMAPWVVRDYIIETHRGYKREEVGSGWKEYAEALEKRDSVVRTCSDKEHYEPIYGRYLRDESQSETAKATRAGRAVI
ncbi:glutathione-S-transferase [Heliocybe sulcata]|uniref:Glutathione-dependent dehydroascorbate reductase n=1 Tax=Heliocybe sulcata TaxID=5364 RepID=A0A5C3NAS7_9AGAM|nr:glutathione-S-transferase [Heliocybe sulcata]